MLTGRRKAFGTTVPADAAKTDRIPLFGDVIGNSYGHDVGAFGDL